MVMGARIRAGLPPGESLGVAGGGLDAAGWAVNAGAARQGQAGELHTAALLDRACELPGGPTVLHDLRIPGSAANIDHLVISGKTVWIIDTKQWAPGVYWRIGNAAFRGLCRFRPAEKRTTSMAVMRLRNFLRRQGLSAEFAHPTVIVWPSRPDHPALFELALVPLRRCGDTPVLSGRGFAMAVRSMTKPGRFRGQKTRTADPRLVSALAKLLVTPTPTRLDWEVAEILATPTGNNRPDPLSVSSRPRGIASRGRGETGDQTSATDPYGDARRLL